ncbi:MAG: hypothetical protein AB7N24_22445 [Dehalococcoidia bacterium]
MSDSLLDKYKRHPGGEPDSKVVRLHDEDAPDNLGCFGFLRGVGDRAISLELRKLSGHVLAVSYAYILRFEYRPEEGITLCLPDRSIRIRGSRLNTEIRSVRLLDGLIRHRVPWLAEVPRNQALAAGEDQVVIEAIEWEGK